MRTLHQLFDNNRAWATQVTKDNPRFFPRLTEQQKPKYLWIGCSDSRVPANEIVGLPPGEIFVHRNVANLVIHSDLNCLSVLQYAVEVLQVEDVIVCGHYGCGGVGAALSNQQFGLIDNWLRQIKDTHQHHRYELDKIEDSEARIDRLCEINVKIQVLNVCHTGIVQNAWARGQKLSVHGWIYKLSDGLLRDLDLCIMSEAELEEIYRLEIAG